MSSGINFSGVATGIDTEGIIGRLKEIGQRPINLYRRQQVQLNSRLAAWQTVNTRLLALQTSAKALADPRAVGQIKGTIADDKVATVTADATAVPGSYSLVVSELAQTQRISSGVFADGSTSLNLSGDLVINGKTVRLSASDSLGAIATKISSAGAGVTASLLTVGPGDVRMTVSSASTGVAGTMAITSAGVDGAAALSALGLVGAPSTAVRYTTTSGTTTTAYGVGLSSAATNLTEVLGLSADLIGTFDVGGKTISYDTRVDTLQTLVDKIKDGGMPANINDARIATVTANGASAHQVQLSGTSGQPAFANDGNGLLTMLGLTARAATSQQSAAKDAEFTLDGIAFKRPSNDVTNAVAGVTINLLKTNIGAPTTITLSRDSAAASKAVTDFVNAYNDIAKFMKEQFAFNADAPTSTPLGGNLSLQQIQNDLANTMTAAVPGLTGTIRSLSGIGVTLGADGTLNLDSSRLNTMLAQDPQAVAKLFTVNGQGSNNSVRFLRAGDKVQESGTEGYAVVVTVAATQATAVSGRAMTDLLGLPETLGAQEKLTFNGTLLANNAVEVTLAAGLNLTQIIEQINGDSRLNRSLVAYNDGEKLAFRSLAYGSAGSFSVVSDTASGPNTTGVGTTALNRVGLDIEGTIGGEAATGSGQMLTGRAGNARTDGLSVLVDVAAAGTAGSVSVHHGVASRMAARLAYLTDATDGMVAGLTQTVQKQIEDITANITRMNERLTAYENQLRKQFTVMERQVARFQAIGMQLSQQIAGLMGNNQQNQR